MAKTISIKPEEAFARSYADRLILLQLSEMEAAVKLGDLAERLNKTGIGLAAVRSLLASNPNRFAYAERRWVPAARLEAQGRPFHEIVRLQLDRFGGPMSQQMLTTEVARVRKVAVEAVAPDVDRVLRTSPVFVVSPGGLVALSEWGFTSTDETIERAFALNRISAEEVEAAQKKLGKFDWRAEGAPHTALAKLAPISAKVLGAVAWLALNPQDPRAILMFDGRAMLAELIDLSDYVLGADGVLYPASDVKQWLNTAVKLADKLAPTIDLEDAAPIEVKVADVVKMVQKIVGSDASVTATKLLEEFYEITPSNKTFPDDLHNVMAALSEQPEVWWVGGDRFRKAQSAPDFIHETPDLFQFVASDVRNEEGELVDVELTDDGLSSSLRKLLTHPLAMDVLDEDILPAPKMMPEKLRLVLKSIHRELGTFPMAQIPTSFLDSSPNIQELIFVDQMGRELQVWANLEARLLFNLIDWWFEQPTESGSVFSLAKTPRANVFEFAWEEQADPVVYISTQRMEELRGIQTRSEGMSGLDVLVEVMGHWPKGADFLTILAEVNVVRRTPRRLVASLLSSYQCFYQRSGSPVWHYDHKKLDQGFDKTKKKFIKKV